jgi:hypothetical protein
LRENGFKLARFQIAPDQRKSTALDNSVKSDLDTTRLGQAGAREQTGSRGFRRVAAHCDSSSVHIFWPCKVSFDKKHTF